MPPMPVVHTAPTGKKASLRRGNIDGSCSGILGRTGPCRSVQPDRSKFAVAALAIKTTAKETWYAFSTRWLTVFGVPRRIIVDGASSFKGDFAAEVREAGIQKLVTGPYYPQGNGVVEAFHKFLRHSMGALTLGTKADLDKAINYSMLAYNQTPHGVGLDLIMPITCLTVWGISTAGPLSRDNFSSSFLMMEASVMAESVTTLECERRVLKNVDITDGIIQFSLGSFLNTSFARSFTASSERFANKETDVG
eukprot:GHVQ01041225.1.p1 GENE.GHVQ01041225.1~~GHVQ01041225.1.p1  ORF type:complete len:251 (+),score=16.38 GHVQ01041225.1:1430-2182(+)